MSLPECICAMLSIEKSGNVLERGKLTLGSQLTARVVDCKDKINVTVNSKEKERRG